MLNGALVEIGERPRRILLTGTLSEKLPGRVLYKGSITLRYGLAFLYERDAFFVERIIDDFGRQFEGQQALDFAARGGDAFPRATVVGVRASSGEKTEVFLKQLDLARDALPTAYCAEDDVRPAGFVDIAIWIDAASSDWDRINLADDTPLSAPLVSAVPCFRLPSDQLTRLPALVAAEFP
jgi:hypothetical protein